MKIYVIFQPYLDPDGYEQEWFISAHATIESAKKECESLFSNWIKNASQNPEKYCADDLYEKNGYWGKKVLKAPYSLEEGEGVYIIKETELFQ